jgi:hypothetical protein
VCCWCTGHRNLEKTQRTTHDEPVDPSLAKDGSVDTGSELSFGVLKDMFYNVSGRCGLRAQVKDNEEMKKYNVKFAQKFDIENYTNKLLELYQSALNEKTPSAAEDNH